MQYLVAVGLVVGILALWAGVDALYRKRGLRSDDQPRTTCRGCQCGGEDTCVSRAEASLRRKED
ncbi:hypothetical protein JCM14469_23090 [Desulfatiferula olefinivorans]